MYVRTGVLFLLQNHNMSISHYSTSVRRRYRTGTILTNDNTSTYGWTDGRS